MEVETTKFIKQYLMNLHNVNTSLSPKLENNSGPFQITPCNEQDIIAEHLP